MTGLLRQVHPPPGTSRRGVIDKVTSASSAIVKLTSWGRARMFVLSGPTPMKFSKTSGGVGRTTSLCVLLGLPRGPASVRS